MASGFNLQSNAHAIEVAYGMQRALII